MPGDFELVEAGTALAVFCFLPWAHLKRGHAVVDLFWRAYPPALQRLLDVAADLLMLGVWLLLVWRMALAMANMKNQKMILAKNTRNSRALWAVASSTPSPPSPRSSTSRC